MEERAHPIITKPHEYKIVYLGISLDDEDYENSYIDIHLKKELSLKGFASANQIV